MIICMQIGKPADPSDKGAPLAIYWDRTGLVLGGWEITEPEILEAFQGRRLAYFEVEEDQSGDLRILRAVEDPGWSEPLI